MKSLDWFRARCESADFVRVVAFGSSNTGRRLPGMHWFDCLDLACRSRFGEKFAMINSGRGGDTTADLLARLERDCLAHQPDLVLVTIGGNDSFAGRGVTPAQYRENLETLIRRLRSAGAEPVMQTYYSFDLAAEEIPPEDGSAFLANMETVRETARAHGCPLVDHLARWEPLRQRCPKVYRRLLVDAAHLNPTGNLLMGLDLARHFGLELPETPDLREARALQALLDLLAGARESFA